MDGRGTVREFSACDCRNAEGLPFINFFKCIHQNTHTTDLLLVAKPHNLAWNLLETHPLISNYGNQIRHRVQPLNAPSPHVYLISTRKALCYVLWYHFDLWTSWNDERTECDTERSTADGNCKRLILSDVSQDCISPQSLTAPRRPQFTATRTAGPSQYRIPYQMLTALYLIPVCCLISMVSAYSGMLMAYWIASGMEQQTLSSCTHGTHYS